MTYNDILALINEKKALGSDSARVEITDLAAVLFDFQNEIGGFSVSGTPSTNQVPKWNGTAVVWANDDVVASGTIGTLQQVMNAGKETNQDVYRNITLPATAGNPTTKVWEVIDNLTKTTRTDEFQRVQWYRTQSSTDQGGVVNEVMNMGWNIGAGGGQVIPNKGGIGISFESNFLIAGKRTYEYHDWFLSNLIGQVRMMSYTAQMGTNAISDPDYIDLYHAVSRFALKRPAANNAGESYFSVLPAANGASAIVSANETDKIVIQYLKTGASITGSGFNPGAEVLTFSGFNDINFGNVQVLNGGNAFLRLNGASLQAFNQTELIGIFGVYAFRGIAMRAKSSAVVAADINEGYYQVIKRTDTNEVRLYVNDGGTLKSVVLA